MESVSLAVLICAAALIEGRNGALFVLRSRATLRSAGLPSPSNSEILIQEFGFYSLAISAAYVLAIFDSVRRPGILSMGIAINSFAAMMHLSRSLGLYIGDTKDRLPSRSERLQACTHAVSILLLLGAFLASSPRAIS